MPIQFDIDGTAHAARPTVRTNVEPDEGEVTEIQCGHCDSTVDEAECVDTRDENNVCEQCISDEFYFIESASDYVHSDECVYVESTNQAELIEDTFGCDHCGETDMLDNSTPAINEYSNRVTICSGCVENGGWTYPEDDCDTLYHIDGLHYSERLDCYFADYDAAHESNGPLHCYSTNVLHQIDDIAYTSTGSTSAYRRRLVFGVELETGSRGDCAQDIAYQFINDTDFESYGICKEDGSVDGPELVTLPATLNAHRDVYKWADWTGALRPIARGHYGNAGMHVHINKGAISSLTLGKMLVFCNSVDNSELLSMIAQRDVTRTQWCELNPTKFDKVGKSAADPHNGKYSILNVTQNTVECRMFNSSLVPERVIKNIEFCHALVQFCVATSARQLTANVFKTFIASNASEYPELSAFITNRSEA